MAEIRITLQSDLCAGNGESSGNFVDTDLCLDAYGLPVIPGRRIKGCLRQGADFLKQAGLLTESDLEVLFGTSSEPGLLEVRNGEIHHAQEIRNWLDRQPESIREAVLSMYTTIRGQTRLKDGVADHGSLRYTRVLNRKDPATGEALTFHVPVYLHSKDEEWQNKLTICCKAVRHMGTHRNRGLGWVRVEYEPNENRRMLQDIELVRKENDSLVTIPYQIRLNSDIIMAEKGQIQTYIPGRSVVGCMASAWIKKYGRPDGKFDRIFLSGDVIWSDLTPSIGSVPSVPAPLMMVWLKYAEKYHNRLSQKEQTADKMKTIDGKWAVPKGNAWEIHSVETLMAYHHRHAKPDGMEAMLYTQEAVPSGLALGGTVVVPAELADEVKELIKYADLRFGRSKSAQYGRCELIEGGTFDWEDSGTKTVREGEPLFILLESNMLLTENGRYDVDARTIRKHLANQLRIRVDDECPAGMMDFIQYNTLGGYHAQWHLFRPQVEIAAGGSVFCFTARESSTNVPATMNIGENQQEGMGRCRVITAQEMENLTGAKSENNTPQSPETYKEEEITDFIMATTRQQAKNLIAESALQLFNKKIKTMNQYRDIDESRLRLMTDEASTPEEMKSWIEEMKNKDRKEAALFLWETICKCDDGPGLPLVTGDKNILNKMQIWPKKEKEQFRQDHWQDMMRIVLQMVARDTSGKGETEEEPE